MRRIITLLLFFLTYVAKTQQWSIRYESDEYDDFIFTAGDNSGNYDYFVGFCSDNVTGVHVGVAVCADENGNYKDRVFWQDGKKSKFTHVLGLDDGNAFVSSLYSDEESSDLYEKLWVAILNPELDIVIERYIDLDEPYITYIGKTYTLRNDDNEIVLLTRVADYESYNVNDMFDYVFYVFDDSCNLKRQSYLENETHRSDITDFTIVPNTDSYAIFGNGMHVSGMSNVIFVDEDFNYLKMKFFDDMNDYPDLMLPIRMCVDYWYDESHFLLSAQTTMTTGINDWSPLLAKIDTEMNVVKSLDLERVDTTDYVFEFKSMEYVAPDKIYVATFWERRDLPNELNIYLINDDLELLGRKSMITENCFFGLHIHSTKDGGCVIAGKETIPDSENPIIYKFAADEFGIDVNVIKMKLCYETVSYPNPVSSVLNINVGYIVDEKVRIYVVDVLGRRYLDKEIFLDGNMLLLDVSSLESGTYFYEITKDKKSILKNRFVKQ